MVSEDLAAQVAVLASRVTKHDQEFQEVQTDLKEATKALWAAVEAVRDRPQIGPVVATIITVTMTFAGVGWTAAFLSN